MTEANKQKYNLIQQYLDGSLDPERMHELEKEALEDPFLAEALEGYSAFEGSVQPHLSLLQRQLEARIADNAVKKNMFFFTWQRISVAAAASLLFISASILFWMKGTNTESRLADNAKDVEVTLTPNDKLGEESQDAEKYSQNKEVTEEVEALTALRPPGNETKIQPKIVTSGTDKKNKETQRYAAGTRPAPAISDTPSEKVEGFLPDKTRATGSLTASASIASAEPGQNAPPAYARGQVIAMRGTRVLSTHDSGRVHERASSAANSTDPQTVVVQGAVQPLEGWENYQAYVSKNKRLPAPAEGIYDRLPGEAKYLPHRKGHRREL
jgi:hypothetical protein